MAKELVRKEIPIQSNQIEDVTEYIQLLQTLDADQKKELRGIIRGMQVMKEIMTGGTQKMVV